MGGGALDLAELVRGELSRLAPPAARQLADAIREQVGPAAEAVLFYGSCLRKDSAEGVLDFYVVVDDYARAFPDRWITRTAADFPPSVFYVEVDGPEGLLRSKYALLSREDLARGAEPGGFRTGIWARFCQPALATWVRDAEAREALVAVCAQSVITAVETLAPLLPGPASSEEFWQSVFRETYAREMRTESAETIRSLHDADPERYERALRAALAELEVRGFPRARWEGTRFSLDLDPDERERARRAWDRRRPLAKLVYVGQLLKTAFTFGDWLPYALWKLERHTGNHIPYSERQRRHPLVFGWPLLFRALRNRDLR